MRYLLDTNIISDLIRNPQGRVTSRIRDLGEAKVATSIVVAAELRYGAAKKGQRASRHKSRPSSAPWKYCLSRNPSIAHMVRFALA